MVPTRVGLSLAAIVITFGSTDALMQAPAAPATPAKTPVWQFMKNEGDVQYTTNMTIGGQTFQALLDTGSFEMLVFSQHCTVCGNSQGLFNDSASSTYTAGDIHTDHGFGSGTTWSFEAFDTVSVGNLSATHQLFWEVYDADMPLLEQGSPFQLLVGVGPPQSAVKMALEAVESVKEEVKNRKEQGITSTTDGENQEIVDQYEKTAQLAKNITSFVGKLDLEVYSFCFLKPSGFGGFFVMHDKDPEEPERATMFTKVPVVGDLYWSAAMTDAQLGDGTQVLGCDTTACSAVIDTGTSLIVAPTEAVDKVDMALQKWLANNGSCSDLSLFPEFEFKLNGTVFTLPPEAYIGEIPSDDYEDDLPMGISTMLAHWKKRAKGSTCVPFMMTSDMPTQFGPLWILGMPFFRKYYSSFKLEALPAGSPTLSQPWVPGMSARNMYFAEADDQCKPAHRAEASLVRPALPLEQRRQRAMRVDPKNLRVPTWSKAVGGGAASLRI